MKPRSVSKTRNTPCSPGPEDFLETKVGDVVRMRLWQNVFNELGDKLTISYRAVKKTVAVFVLLGYEPEKIEYEDQRINLEATMAAMGWKKMTEEEMNGRSK